MKKDQTVEKWVETEVLAKKASKIVIYLTPFALRASIEIFDSEGYCEIKPCLENDFALEIMDSLNLWHESENNTLSVLNLEGKYHVCYN